MQKQSDSFLCTASLPVEQELMLECEQLAKPSLWRDIRRIWLDRIRTHSCSEPKRASKPEEGENR